MRHNHDVVVYGPLLVILNFDSDLEIIHVLCQDVLNLGEKLAAYT